MKLLIHVDLLLFSNTVVIYNLIFFSFQINNKPQTERKRRERINKCLGQLKCLVFRATGKDVSQKTSLTSPLFKLQGELKQRSLIAIFTFPKLGCITYINCVICNFRRKSIPGLRRRTYWRWLSIICTPWTPKIASKVSSIKVSSITLFPNQNFII